MRRGSFIKIILLFIFVFFGDASNGFCSESECSNAFPTATRTTAGKMVWNHIGSNSTVEYSCAMETLKCCPGGIIKVWTKLVFSKQAVAAHVKDFGNKYKKLKYTTCLELVDCENSKKQLLSCEDYAKDGSVIERIDFQEPKWSTIFPDTIPANLEEMVCGSCNYGSGQQIKVYGAPTPVD